MFRRGAIVERLKVGNHQPSAPVACEISAQVLQSRSTRWKAARGAPFSPNVFVRPVRPGGRAPPQPYAPPSGGFSDGAAHGRFQVPLFTAPYSLFTSPVFLIHNRSEERRVGKECISRCST